MDESKDNSQVDYNDLLRLRVQAEIDRTNAETANIKNGMNQKWYKNIEIIKYVIAGVIAAGLLAAWVITYFQPIMTKRLELKEIEVQSKNQELTKSKQEFEKVKEEFEKVKEESQKRNREYQAKYAKLDSEYAQYQIEWQRSTSEIEKLRTQLDEISNLYDKTLGELSITKKENQLYAEMLKSRRNLDSTLQIVTGRLDSLKVVKANLTESSNSLKADRLTNDLIDSKWKYSDSRKRYDLFFKSNNILKTSDTDDRTPGDDRWEVRNDSLFLYLNDEYVNMQGAFIGITKVKGSARNKDGKGWDWQAERYEY